MGESGATRVKVKPADKKEVQARWMDMQLARKNFDYIASIFKDPLPKHLYSKRKNGKKVKLHQSALRQRTGLQKGRVSRSAAPDSKYMQWFGQYMQAGMILKQAEQAFSDALARQEKKGKGSIKALIEEQTPKALA